jgi:hypothetical protein
MTAYQPQSQQALHRVLGYLAMLGVPITTSIERRALAMIAEAMDSAPEDVLGESMRRLPDYFELPIQHPPHPAPPLHRSSLGYGDY